MNFRKMTANDAESVGDILRSLGDYTCESTFINLFIYQELYSDEMALENGQLFIKSESADGVMFRLPMGGDLKQGIEKIREYLGGAMPVFWTPDGELFGRFRELYSDYYSIEAEDEGMSDYIYSKKALCELSGKKYHSKRNHISAFSKKYDWRYEAITKDNIGDVYKCADIWYGENSERLDKYLDGERRGVMLLLDNFAKLNAQGGIIYVDDMAVAFTVGSAISDTVYNIHIEKALKDFSGAYTVINREFAKRLPDEVRYINREDDMGLDGLRRAKRSYYPEIMLKKYICVPK